MSLITSGVERSHHLGCSPEFRRWFGASRVVTDQGLPLIVYHGTDRDFSEFQPGAVGSKYGLDHGGFFFTQSPFEAGLYAMGNALGGRTLKGAIYPVYLSLQNPLIIDDEYAEARWSTNGPETVHPARFIDYMREEIWEVVESGRHDGFVLVDGERSMYVARHPSQIKSAIGNSGAFNPANPDICDRLPAPVSKRVSPRRPIAAEGLSP